MFKKLTIECDDFRDVVAFNDSVKLWREMFNMLSEIEDKIAISLTESNYDEEDKNQLCDKISQITDTYRKVITPMHYTKNGETNTII